MRGLKGRRSAKIIYRPQMSISSTPTSVDSTLAETDSPPNYEKLIGECDVGKMKTTVEQMLQDHFENITRIILMEECTSKQCYVKVTKLSHIELTNSVNEQKSNRRYYPRQKKRINNKKKLIKSHQNNVGRKHDENIQVSTLTVTIPRIRRKTPRARNTLSSNIIKHDHLMDEILVDPAENITPSLPSNCTNNKSVEVHNGVHVETKRKPVIIPIKRRKNNASCNKNIQGKTNEVHNRIVEEKEELNKAPQQMCNVVSDNTKKKPDLYTLEGSSLVSFSTPSLHCTPYTPTKLIKQRTSKFSKRREMKWNNNIRHEKRKKSMLRKWKEQWTVRLNASYEGGLAVLFKRACPNKPSTFTPTKIPLLAPRFNSTIDPPPFRPITDQELNDGLPDIFDFDQ